MTDLVLAVIGNVSWIEILWTAVAAAGLGFAAENLVEAYRDLSVVDHEHDPVDGKAKEILAVSAIITEWMRAAVQTIFILIGVLAMVVAMPSSHVQLPLKLRIFGWVFQYGLVIAAALCAGKSVVLWETRRRLNTLAGRRRRGAADRIPQ